MSSSKQAAQITSSSGRDTERLLFFSQRKLSKIRASIASSSTPCCISSLRQIDDALNYNCAKGSITASDDKVSQLKRLKEEVNELTTKAKNTNMVASHVPSTLSDDNAAEMENDAMELLASINIKNVKKSEALDSKSNNPRSIIDDGTDTTSAVKIQELLVQQKTINQREITEEKKLQTALMNEVSELTSALKEASLRINQAVVQQNVQLDSIQQYASENVDELHDQKEKVGITYIYSILFFLSRKKSNFLYYT